MEDSLFGSWAGAVRGREVFHFPVNELIDFLRGGVGVGTQNRGLHFVQIC